MVPYQCIFNGPSWKSTGSISGYIIIVIILLSLIERENLIFDERVNFEAHVGNFTCLEIKVKTRSLLPSGPMPLS
jgi:hypothetical protein